MPRFVIERDMPGAGKMTPAQLADASRHSCGVLDKMGPKLHWVHSYVTDDKIYCIYHAESEKLVLDHAKLSGFPVSRISQVRTVIDPTTAELH